ncbi:Insulin-like growth factor binding protein, N-terminal [Pseudocohnilembus persalinus]|uniref:Insulin-like growth factor binding protein, N-terminal n=1 Tax=Pseudocohnilembus persalinus TaxID=266149 RepID=A0A0V0QYZ0_PSEPJ|nr:Insulin-like growth factor binding protein, N-terminal [Pseudocohnilembus persalinus]|eukprot:KRX07409.1 Insulin-like growth factor binding protein, N-terminal [Pseudocohnilembus persalinus]
MTSIFLLLIGILQIHLYIQQTNLSWFYLKESDFYFGYELENYSTSAKAHFQVKGQYDGWIALGIQDDIGNEDITMLYNDGATPCLLEDYYRVAGTQEFIKDSNQNFQATNIAHCQGSLNANQFSFSKMQYNGADLNQDIKIVGDTSYKIDSSTDDLESIKLLPKSQQTYYIPFSTVQNPCMHTCSSKTKECETSSDYKEFTASPEFNNAFFCFTNEPPVWNKLYNSVDDFEIYYGVKYIFNVDYDPSQPISGQQQGFIYFRLVGQSVNSATYGGFIGVSLVETSTTNNPDLFIVTKVNGLMEVIDSYINQGTLTSGNDITNSVQLVTGEKDDVTNIYDVTVVRPLLLSNADDIDIITAQSTANLGASKIYELTLYFGTTDVYTSGKLTNADAVVWDEVIFFEEQYCGYQCESNAWGVSPYCTSQCFTTNEPCYDCPSNYCLGPDPDQCYSCHDNCKTCVGPYSNDCTSCLDTDNRILYLNECVINRPLYWNKIFDEIDLNLYYGFDASYSQIYFKAYGQDSGKNLIITISDGTDTDSYEIQQSNNLQNSDNLEFIYVTGIYNSGDYEIHYLRSKKKSDSGLLTVEIGFNVQYTIAAAYSAGGNSYSDSNFFFSSQQICGNNCDNCVGPEDTECTSCQSGYELTDTLPGTCQDTTTLTDCTVMGPLYIRLDSMCYLKYPQFWNKLELGDTNFDLYYGFEMDYDNLSPAAPTLIYFRLVGYNKGWVALAFGSNHDQIDMVVIRIKDGQILVEDRISGTHKDYKMAIRSNIDGVQNNIVIDSGINQQPVLDTEVGSHYKLIEGNRNEKYVWDVTFVRKVDTGDINQDKNLIDDIKYIKTSDPSYDGQRIPVTLALGNSDNFVKHSTYQRNYIKFDTQQKCDDTCVQCSGSESYQCTKCDSNLYGIQDNTAPNFCKRLEYYCHMLCETCYGKNYNQCLTCADSSLVAIKGNCISKAPSFWNKLTVNANLNLFYGYSKDLTKIFFRFKGIPDTSNKGWVGLGFGNSWTSTDTVIIRKQTKWNGVSLPTTEQIVLVEDRFSEDSSQSFPKLDYEYDSSQDYYYIEGNRDETTYEWDVTIMRFIDNVDSYDIYIDSTKRDLTIAWGENDQTETNIGQQILTDVRLRTYQVCSSLCLDCIGPEDNECNVCIAGYELAGTAPNICQVEVLTCHSDCDTGQCTGTSSSDCTACSSYDDFVLLGSCVLKEPAFWNKIKINENLDFYYGFNSEDTIFYSKFKGNASGWVAIGYNIEMRNTDMIIVRKDPGNLSQILVEDRYSLGHTIPLLDMRQDSVMISGSWSGDNIDVTYARYKNTKDTVRDTIITHNERNLIFAIGSGHDFASTSDVHTNVYSLENMYFFNFQQCPENCLQCTGPEDSECSEWEKQVDNEIHKRRRARNDPNNRDYKCPCGKSYLSYPALYTHIKQKHNGKNPSNNDQEGYDQEESYEMEALNVIEELLLYIYSSVNSSILLENTNLTAEQLKNAFPQSNFFGENNEKEYKPIFDKFQMIVDQQGNFDEEIGPDGLFDTNINTILANFLYQFSLQAQEYLIQEMGFYVCMLRKSLNKRKPEVIFADNDDEEDDEENEQDKTQEKEGEKKENSEKKEGENENNKNEKQEIKQNNNNNLLELAQQMKEKQEKLQKEQGDDYDYCENNSGRMNNNSNNSVEKRLLKIYKEFDSSTPFDIEEIKAEKKKVILIMGAGNGLGASIARQFASNNFIVIVCRRNREKLNPLIEEIQNKGQICHGFGVDCRQQDQVIKLVNDVENFYGPINVAVFNIGINVNYDLMSTSSRIFEKIWQLNTYSGFLFGQAVASKMIQRQKGTILFTGASASLRGNPGFTAFGASKAGLRSIAQSMSKELGPQGIHVAHIIVDGGIDSPFIREQFKDKLKDINEKENYLLNPDDIAKVYYDIYKQKKSAWTFEIDVRPYTEKW